MTLEIGNVERIENPSPDQVRHFLRFMPASAPYVILSSGDDSFIQAAPDGDDYRVEYRLDGRQYFARVPFEQAAELFEAFRAGDDTYRHAAPWRPLTVMNNPRHPAVLVGLVLIIVLVAVLQIYSFFR